MVVRHSTPLTRFSIRRRPLLHLSDNSSVERTERAPDLRRRAELQLESLDKPLKDANTPEATEQLIHELRVHQIELELQNEELRQTQENLATSRARYFDLYDLAPVGYLTLSEDGVIQEANLAAATLLDAPRETLVDQPLTRFILPEDQDTHYHARRQLLATGERQTYDLRLCRADDALAWVHLDISQRPEATSERIVWSAILSDISARKRDEQALIESQARLRLITHIADLTFWEWDPKTQAVFFPPEWWRQTGYTLDELPHRLGPGPTCCIRMIGPGPSSISTASSMRRWSPLRSNTGCVAKTVTSAGSWPA
ncbi:MULTISPECIES: PAS domain-containing protein [Thiorhodovibrio]|uniref:PAS domain-containing protein n=1 Tax=Thiorhodovibrio TaxID=61593 RepID=UPI002B25E548|nr:PAS domain S-box protein [Thiorhodovibrio litoralis]